MKRSVSRLACSPTVKRSDSQQGVGSVRFAADIRDVRNRDDCKQREARNLSN